MTTGHCVNNTKFFLGIIVPNIVTDILILGLPIREISKLYLPLSQRLALGSVFLLGSGVVAASAIRLYYHLDLARAGRFSDITSKFTTQ